MLALAIAEFSRFQDISPSVTSSKMLYAGLPSPIRVPGASDESAFGKDESVEEICNVRSGSCTHCS